MWIVDRLINFAYWHGGELFTILVGIWLILYGCFARRMTFEGEVAVSPEDRVYYKPTREMRLLAVIVGASVVLWGLWGTITWHLHGHGIGSVVRHAQEITAVAAGISIFLYFFANRNSLKKHPKARIYLLAFAVFSFCYSLYACIRRH